MMDLFSLQISPVLLPLFPSPSSLPPSFPPSSPPRLPPAPRAQQTILVNSISAMISCAEKGKWILIFPRYKDSYTWCHCFLPVFLRRLFSCCNNDSGNNTSRVLNLEYRNQWMQKCSKCYWLQKDIAQSCIYPISIKISLGCGSVYAGSQESVKLVIARFWWNGFVSSALFDTLILF